MPKFTSKNNLTSIILSSLAIISFLVIPNGVVHAQDYSYTANAETSKTTSSTSSTTDLRKNLFGLGSGKEAELKAARERLIANKKLAASERKTELENLRKLTATNRCNTIKANFAARMEVYDTLYQADAARYAKIVSSLTELTDRLQAAGYDVTALSADLEKLKAYVADFTTAYNNLQAKLIAAQADACNPEAVTTYKQNVAKAIELVNAWKTGRDIVVRYIKQDIKTILESIKQDRQAQNSSTN